MKITDHEEEFWVVQAPRAEKLLAGRRFTTVIASVYGDMARITTTVPETFVSFKRWMAERADRDPLKRSRDRLQADIVEMMMREHLIPGTT
jgi:hypothetical protein